MLQNRISDNIMPMKLNTISGIVLQSSYMCRGEKFLNIKKRIFGIIVCSHSIWIFRDCILLSILVVNNISMGCKVHTGAYH